ncbi:tyrosine--tRNA ligase [Patescibacteria group bacterium]|nr:MAG: tyrosine--tRNA ligase [Patescibacteria group bacterium]
MFLRNNSNVSTDNVKIEELLSRSVNEVIPSNESLRKLLLSGKKLRIKLGIDPTSPNVHIGRAVTLLKLKDFQDLGHTVVFIIGDATGVVGDTSDKTSERPMLSRAEIEKNLTEYVNQVEKILNKKQLEVRHNSEWLLQLDYAEIGEQANAFSVAEFIARDNIRKRLDEGKRVSLREVLYPLMQGYDSVAVKADVELGGTDQRFNLLAGRTLQEKLGQFPQHVLMTELILGTDGRKMSSSWGNTINLNDAPNDMFGKVMSIPDTLIKEYFVHVTRVPFKDIEIITALSPRDAKLALATEIVRMYHSITDAEKARDRFISVFSKGEISEEDAVEVRFTREQSYADALVMAKVVQSKTELRRLISAGAVSSITRTETIDDLNEVPQDQEILKIGKRRIVKMVKN